MTTTAEDAPVLKCRYRYAIGCNAEFGSRPGLLAHEKNAHPEHSVELRVCPECGEDSGSEMERARHLSNRHGAAAGSHARQEMDARQVLQLLGPRIPAAVNFRPESAGPDAAPEDEPEPEAAEPRREPEPAEPEPAAPDLLSAARDILDKLAGEVEALRAENTTLKSENARMAAEADTLATVRTLLAGQNGTREHANAM